MFDPVPTDRPVRWGILSTGSIASQFVQAFAEVPAHEGEIVAVASRSSEAANRFGDELGIETRHGSYEAMAADSNVDVVYVATPYVRHKADVLALLAGGRHVLCEKPFAVTTADARDMFAAAKAHERFLMEAQWARFHPGYIQIRELIEAGAIGTPQMVDADFRFSIPMDKREGHRLFDPQLAGGGLLDLGVYPIQVALLALGHPDRISAVATLNDDGIDEQCGLLLGHPGGGLSVLSTAVTTNGTNTARITGTDGHIEIDAFQHAFRRMTVVRGAEREVIEPPPPSLHWQTLAVHESLRSGETRHAGMPESETLAIMEVLDEARRQTGLVYPFENDVPA